MTTASRTTSTSRFAATLIGMTAGTLLFAMVGSITDRALWGAFGGAAVGAVVGWGWQTQVVSRAVVWICCFAAAGAFIGPGCDADSLSSALAFGAVGAWIGYAGLRGVGALFGSLIGVNIGAAGGGGFGLVGLFAGGFIGWMFASMAQGNHSNADQRAAA